MMLNGPAGRIELAIDLPEHSAQPVVAIVSHPHPPDGGSMHNKVVTMTARALRECGVRVVRFNFRGVGASDGVYDEGRGETLDLIAVAEWAAKQNPGAQLWLAGFSFGAWVSLRAARQLPVKFMISIAPPVGFRDFDGVPSPNSPWLVIQGDEDEVISGARVYEWLESLDVEDMTLVRMPQTGHFFHRRLMDLRGALKNGIKKHLPQPPAA